MLNQHSGSSTTPLTNVADTKHHRMMRIRIPLFTYPDPTFYFEEDLDPVPHLKVMQICDHWSPEPSGVHSEPSHLHRERQRPSRV
jgi:hypothetical protein